MAGRKRAVVILSGGLDSTTCMGIARQAGYALHALTFDYGQRHRIEIEHARKVANFYGAAEHQVLDLGFLGRLGGSSLTDKRLLLPTSGVGQQAAIPSTYVPGRNLLFLSIAASYAEVCSAAAIYLGVNALDYSGYPDCRPEFMDAVRDVLATGTKAGVEGRPIQIETPLLHWTKAEIIGRGMALGVPYQLTSSCYQGSELACGVCDSCRLRLKGFADAGFEDPIAYAGHGGATGVASGD